MQYNPRQHQYTGSLEDAIGGYAGYEEHEAVTPRNHHRDVKRFTGAQQPNRQQMTAAQRQEEVEARVRQNRTNRSPASARRRSYPPVNKSYRDGDAGIDGDGDVWPAQAPRSAIRYNVPPEGIYPEGEYQIGNQRFHVEYQYAQVPLRAHAQPQPQPAPQQQDRFTAGGEEEAFEEDEHVTRLPRKQRTIHYHWLVFAGIALLLMLSGWFAFNDLGVWWQTHQDDVTYGMPRTYQTDAVVGHSDSNSNPSHFIALNLRGQIYVIELPGGDATKARGYFITSEVGGNPNPPVTVKFQDLTHSGHLDMVVTIGDPPTPLIVFLFNNGSQFAAKAH